MASAMNKVFLLGNLGADPDVVVSRNGDACLKLRLATNEVWRDRESGELRDRTDWHSVSFWGKRAESLSRILRKGDRVMVEGQIRTSSYEKDGQVRYFTEVRARDIYLAGSPRRPKVDDVIEVDHEDLIETGPATGYAPVEAHA